MRIKLETGTVIWFDPAEDGSFKHSLKILNCIGEGGTGMIYTATDDDGITWVVKESFPNTGNSVLSPIRIFRKADGNITLNAESSDRDLISEANRIVKNESEVALCLQNDLTNRIMNMPFYTGALKGAAIQCPGRAVPTTCNQLFSRMQYVKGVTADKASFANELERLRAVRDILEAVAKIHQAGFILGDIKPQNIMITDSGRCFILDYGSAVKTNDRGETEIDPLTYPRSSGYIAPELFDLTKENACLTKAYDVYSLGALLMDLLLPERTKTIREIQYRKRTEFPYSFFFDDLKKYGAFSKMSIRQELPVSPALADQLSRILQRCLADDRNDRYLDAGELLKYYTVFLNNYQYKTVRPQDYNYHLFWQESYDHLWQRLNDTLEHRIENINDMRTPVRTKPEWWKLEPVKGYGEDGVCYSDAADIAEALSTDDVYMYARRGGGKTIKACQIMLRCLWEMPVLYFDLDLFEAGEVQARDPSANDIFMVMGISSQFTERLKTKGDRFLIVLDNISNLGFELRERFLRAVSRLRSEFSGAEILLIGRNEIIEDAHLEESFKKIGLEKLEGKENPLLQIPFFYMRYLEIRSRDPDYVLDTTSEIEFLDIYMDRLYIDYYEAEKKGNRHVSLGESVALAEKLLMETAMLMTDGLVCSRYIYKTTLESILEKSCPQFDRAEIIDILTNKLGVLVPLSYMQLSHKLRLSKEMGKLDFPWISEIGSYEFAHDIYQDYFAAKQISSLIKSAVSKNSLEPISSFKTYMWDHNVVSMLSKFLSQQELDKLYSLLSSADDRDSDYDSIIRSFVAYYWKNYYWENDYYWENEEDTLNRWIELGARHRDDFSMLVTTDDPWLKEVLYGRLAYTKELVKWQDDLDRFNSAADPLLEELIGSRLSTTKYLVKWLSRKTEEDDLFNKRYAPEEIKWIEGKTETDDTKNKR